MEKFFRVVLVFGILFVKPAVAGSGWLMGGAGLGVAGLSNDSTTESNKFGIDLSPEGFFSYDFGGFLIDAGLGYRLDSVRGTLNGNQTTVTTKSGYAHLFPGIKLGEGGWILGPVLQYHFGTSLSFTEIRNELNSDALYLGPQVVYQWENENGARFRIGGRGTFDLTVADRLHWTAQFLFQVGFRLFGGDDAPSEPAPEPQAMVIEQSPPEPIVVQAPPPEPVRPEPWIDVEERGETVVITAYSNAVNFDTDSARLRSKSVSVVSTISRLLAANESKWDRATISGHADERGSWAYNMRLSKRRAKTVKSRFASAGISNSRLTTKAWGEDRPKDSRHNESAWAKNRRVEITLYGVKGRAELVTHFRRGLASQSWR